MSSPHNYSLLDRMLHRLAFGTRAIQMSAADMEQALYGRRYRNIAVTRPIFVSSLPRAGTTLTLELLNGLPGLASHSYRDMPFVMAPMLWNAVSGSFRRQATLRERAHLDGMMVGYDSPEAFEEVLWRSFFPNKFKHDRIELWSADDDTEEFECFYREHMQKIIALRSAGADAARYVSKNNANVARLGLLRRLFPDSVMLIPFREPVSQAVSLHKQHLRFLERHRADPFSKRYMSDIGHLEFGELHRPIWFNGVEALVRLHAATTLDYWLAYWVAGFQHVVGHKAEVILVSYEKLCGAGRAGVDILIDRLGIQGAHAGKSIGPDLHEARRYAAEAANVNPDLLARAQQLHQELLSLSVV